MMTSKVDKTCQQMSNDVPMCLQLDSCTTNQNVLTQLVLLLDSCGVCPREMFPISVSYIFEVLIPTKMLALYHQHYQGGYRDEDDDGKS